MVGMPWVYTNQWACRFLDPWVSMDVENLLQKLNSPPLGVGHHNFNPSHKYINDDIHDTVEILGASHKIIG